VIISNLTVKVFIARFSPRRLVLLFFKKQHLIVREEVHHGCHHFKEIHKSSFVHRDGHPNRYLDDSSIGPVAYFTDGEAVKGKRKFSYAWNEAKWYFATAANRDSFASDPERYAPKYGGY
jgi:YHS domain-containing protein